MKRFSFIFLLELCMRLEEVSSFDRYFIPTQEHFFAQQSSAAVYHHRQQHNFPVSSAESQVSSGAGESYPNAPYPHRPIFIPHPVLNPGFGFGFSPGLYHPFFAGLVTKPTDLGAPAILKPSVTGWETNYNVPCGSYQIYPFVVANLRLGSAPVYGYPPGKRYQRSVEDQIPPDSRSYFPYYPSKTCSWDFSAAGCRLKFKCDWFQLPALFRCEENTLEISDAENEKYTFCGSRQPRRNRVYNSTTGRMTLTFRSQQPSLPAVFDCTVSCGVEYLYSLSPEGSTSGPTASLSNKVTTGGSTGTPTGTASAGQTSSTTATVHSHVTHEPHNVTESSSTTPKPLPLLRYGQCKCGVQEAGYSSRGRIVGGSRTVPGEYPWTAALVRKNSQRPFCSGSLISSLYVATAAHCVLSNVIRQPRGSSLTKDLFDVVLNEHDINEAAEIAGGPIRVRVSQVIIHPNYDNATYNYDIALLRLETPIQFDPPLSQRRSSDIYFPDYRFPGDKRRGMLPEVEARARVPRPVPICLSTRSGKSLVDKSGVVTGWGLTREGGVPSEEMLQATVKIFNESSCREFYREHHYVVTENMICAGYLDGRTDSCVGDSGGGLSILENDRYTLAGIVSWGRGCGREKLPGVYTRIAGLTEWIQSNTLDAIWCN